MVGRISRCSPAVYTHIHHTSSLPLTVKCDQIPLPMQSSTSSLHRGGGGWIMLAGSDIIHQMSLWKKAKCQTHPSWTAGRKGTVYHKTMLPAAESGPRVAASETTRTSVLQPPHMLPAAHEPEDRQPQAKTTAPSFSFRTAQGTQQSCAWTADPGKLTCNKWAV